MGRIKSLMIIVGLFITGTLYAASVNIPSSIEELKGQIWSHEYEPELPEVSVELEGEFVLERELDEVNAQVEGDFYMANLIFSSIEKFDFYISLGEVQNAECRATILNRDVKFDLENEFVLGGGFSYTFTEKKDPWQIGLDIKYRQNADMDYNLVNIDGVAYSKDQLERVEFAEWKEWQVAFIFSKKMNRFTPYGGIKYSDVDVSARATVAGTTYDISSTNSERRMGIFVGCFLTFLEQFSVDIQLRIVDEKAFTGRFAYKF